MEEWKNRNVSVYVVNRVYNKAVGDDFTIQIGPKDGNWNPGELKRCLEEAGITVNDDGQDLGYWGLNHEKYPYTCAVVIMMNEYDDPIFKGRYPWYSAVMTLGEAISLIKEDEDGRNPVGK